MKVWPRRLALGVLVLLLAACGSAASTTSVVVDKRLKVASTVSPITNIIHNIGGSRINLTGIIPEGTDSHTFEPAPSDAKVLSQADIIFVNGLKLEQPTVKLAEANKKAGAEIVQLGENTLSPDQYVYDFSFPKENGSPNPHLWMNPIYGLHYAQIVRDTLTARDPANADFYTRNFNTFQDHIRVLDGAIKVAIDSIPPANRVLLTYHDSFAYFAPRYGMTVIGAIQPADFSEPSAKDVAALILQIRKAKAPAIFGSEVFPSPVLDQIAKEAGAVYVATLRDDDLPGKLSDVNHTYIGLLISDVATMTRALGGDPSKIETVDPSNVPSLN